MFSKISITQNKMLTPDVCFVNINIVGKKISVRNISTTTTEKIPDGIVKSMYNIFHKYQGPMLEKYVIQSENNAEEQDFYKEIKNVEKFNKKDKPYIFFKYRLFHKPSVEKWILFCEQIDGEDNIAKMKLIGYAALGEFGGNKDIKETFSISSFMVKPEYDKHFGFLQQYVTRECYNMGKHPNMFVKKSSYKCDGYAKYGQKEGHNLLCHVD